MTRQRGSITLVISVTLLIAVTLIVFMMARASLMEQRIAANYYRGQQAFEAAEAGLEYAIGRMNAASRATLKSVTTFTEAGFSCNPANTRLDDACAGDPVEHGGAIFEISLDDLDELRPPYEEVEIMSRGYSDDNSAIRDVFVQAAWVPILGNPPPYPLVAKTTVNIGGTSRVTNPSASRCIWSGETAEASYPDHTNCTSLETDPALSDDYATDDEFFENFFLMSRDHLRQQFTPEAVEGQTQLLTPAAVGGTNYWAALVDSYDPDSTAVRAFWINGGGENVEIDGSAGDLGTADVPVLIIIENFSDLIIGGGVTINALIYVAGDWNNESNSATINGGVIVEGGVELGGTFEIAYISADNAPGRYAKIPGSWRDFVYEP